MTVVKKEMTTKLVIPKDLKVGQKFTKTEEDRNTFLKEVARHKKEGHKVKDIAKFYNLSVSAIDKALAEVRQEGLKIYQKNRIGLIEDQLLELDTLITESQKDLANEQDKEIKIKLRKEIRDSLNQKAKLQGLLVDNVQVNNVGNPTEMLLQQFNVFKPNKDASNS